MKLYRSVILGSLFLASGSGLLVGGSGLVLAQTDDGDGFTTQETTAGWALAQPEPTEATTDEQEAGADEQPILVGEQQFGWQVAAPTTDDDEGRLSELERLSVSPSGLRFGGQLYNAKSDNPLEPVSVTIRALDKITAQYTDLIIEMGESSDFGALSITPRTCDKRPPQEFPEVTAFLEILSSEFEEEAAAGAASEEEPGVPQPVQPETTSTTEGNEPEADSTAVVELTEAMPEDEDLPVGTLFSGWMFASSPALNALQHPVYDVWVIDCKMVDPSL